MHVALYIGLVFGDLALQMLEVHLDLLLQFDMTANRRLQFLSLTLQGRITVDTHKILWDHTDEVLHQVVRQNGLRGSDFGILVHLRKLTEIILRGEHGLERVEYAILGLLVDFVAGVFGRGEEGLELFDHYKRGGCV